ncbi:MAG: hypothetical protein QW506_06070 [Thermoproteota archaeon]
MENLVKDSCFTSGLWKITSKPEEVKISLDSVQTPVGIEDSLKIESSGWSKWHLTYGEKLQVKPRETYMLNVRMVLKLKSRKGSVVLEPKILDVNGREIKAIKRKWSGDSGEPFFAEDLGPWRGGIIGAAGKWGWRHIAGGFMIPDGGSQMNLALYGAGPGEVWVTGVELRRNFCSIVKTVKPTQIPEYPKAILYKRLKLGEYAGKVLRVGDLNGDGKVEFLFAQRISPKPIKPSSVNYVALRCLTAVDLNGNILWQLGEPDPSGYDVWSDLPVQVFDFNKDVKWKYSAAKTSK